MLKETEMKVKKIKKMMRKISVHQCQKVHIELQFCGYTLDLSRLSHLCWIEDVNLSCLYVEKNREFPLDITIAGS